MNNSNRTFSTKQWGSVYYASFLMLFAFVAIRNFSANPSVFGDEYTYMIESQFQKLNEVGIPDYLFYFIFGITKHFGPWFYVASKILNLVLWVVSGFLLYKIASRSLSNNWSAFVALVGMALPSNFFTSFYLPENLFSASFLAFTYVCFFTKTWNQNTLAILMGLLSGVLCLIRPHAISVLVAACVFQLLLDLRKGWSLLAWIRGATRSTAVLVLGLGIKFGVNFLISGVSGLTFFGTTYSSNFDVVASEVNEIVYSSSSDVPSISFGLLSNFWTFGLVLLTHFVALSLFFGPRLSEIVIREFRIGRLSLPNEPHAEVALFVFLTLVSGIFLSSAFSFLTNISIGEPLERLHMRYYGYIFPLLVFLVLRLFIEESKSHPSELHDSKRKLKFFILTSFAVLAWVFYPWRLFIQYQDAPDLFSITYIPIVYFLFVMLVLIGSLAASPINRLKLFIAQILIICMSGLAGSAVAFSKYSADQFGDTLGARASKLIPSQDISKTLVVGRSASEPLRTSFFIRGKVSTALREDFAANKNFYVNQQGFVYFVTVGFEDSLLANTSDWSSCKADGCLYYKRSN